MTKTQWMMKRYKDKDKDKDTVDNEEVGFKTQTASR